MKIWIGWEKPEYVCVLSLLHLRCGCSKWGMHRMGCCMEGSLPLWTKLPRWTALTFLMFLEKALWEIHSTEFCLIRCSVSFCFSFEINYNPRLAQWLSGEESTCSAGEAGLISGSGRSSGGGGNGSPLQYSCLENPVDRGAWWATVHRVENSGTNWSNWAHITQDLLGPNCYAEGCYADLFCMLVTGPSSSLNVSYRDF